MAPLGLTAILAFLSGTWFPLTHGFLYDVGRYYPGYWIVQASHIAIGGQGWSPKGWVVVAAWTVVLVALARIAYRRDTQRCRRVIPTAVVVLVGFRGHDRVRHGRRNPALRLIARTRSASLGGESRAPGALIGVARSSPGGPERWQGPDESIGRLAARQHGNVARARHPGHLPGPLAAGRGASAHRRTADPGGQRRTPGSPVQPRGLGRVAASRSTRCSPPRG
jgi:hypothetical protein